MKRRSLLKGFVQAAASIAFVGAVSKLSVAEENKNILVITKRQEHINSKYPYYVLCW